MEKAIEIIMLANKSIQINRNGISVCTILENDRKISAQKIFDILEFNPGDKFTVIAKNEFKIDEQVILFFKEMFDNIVARVNSMTVEQMTITEKAP